MITPNTDSAFIQIKSLHTQSLTLPNQRFAEVAQMTTQLHWELDRFNDLLLLAVNETLMQIFKEEGVRVIYDFMERSFSLKREEIADKPEGFSMCLKWLLGSAAPMIEKLILENFYSKLGLRFEEKAGCGLSFYINSLREMKTSTRTGAGGAE